MDIILWILAGVALVPVALGVLILSLLLVGAILWGLVWAIALIWAYLSRF